MAQNGRPDQTNNNEHRIFCYSGRQNTDYITGYRDVVLDYKFPEEEQHNFTGKYVMACCKKAANLKEWGLDPYGNLILQDGRKKLYFYDHEAGTITPFNIREVTV